MRLMTFGTALLITLIGFVIAWQFVNPAPPRSVVIATGHPDGAYYLFAREYQEILARNGIELQIRTTAGSIENLALLQNDDSNVSLAFVQGGSSTEADYGRLTSLASLYYEPLWIFYRDTRTLTRLTELQGKSIAIGEAGSGTHAISSMLLADNFIDTGSDDIQAIGGDSAARALSQGKIDAMFMVAGPEGPLLQQLLYRSDIRLMSLDRVSAYTRIHQFLSAVTLPEGVIDLQANIPPADVDLLAATANLVARQDIHPALVSLLLQAATQVQGRGGLFAAPGDFPNSNHLEFPLDDDARRYFRHGTPFLQRYLPFWTANLIDRLKVMLVPLLTLLLPLIKIMPPAYRWQVRKKVYHWYGELQALDTGTREAHSAASLESLLQRLDVLEEDVRKVNVPLSYADELYSLRLHIGLVRDKLLNRRERIPPAANTG
jgi:TRAP transporter TAXI family solute receptor